MDGLLLQPRVRLKLLHYCFQEMKSELNSPENYAVIAQLIIGAEPV